MAIKLGLMKSPGFKPSTESRVYSLEEVEKYFLQNFAEDSVEGSEFDCDVLDALKKLKEKYQSGK